MKITPDNLISQLLFKTQPNSPRKGGPLADGSKFAELANRKGGPLVDGSKVAEHAKSHGGMKKAAEAAVEIHLDPPHDPVPIEEPSSEPIPADETKATPEVTSESIDNSIQSLAERYVALYERNSGNDLSSEDEKVKVQEIADFYGQDAGHEERLQTLVTSLETEV